MLIYKLQVTESYFYLNEDSSSASGMARTELLQMR